MEGSYYTKAAHTEGENTIQLLDREVSENVDVC